MCALYIFKSKQATCKSRSRPGRAHNSVGSFNSGPTPENHG